VPPFSAVLSVNAGCHLLTIIMPIIFMLIVVVFCVVNHNSQGTLPEGERLSTVDLLVPTCLDPLVLIIQTLTFLQNK
jgi:hypothetical protein